MKYMKNNDLKEQRGLKNRILNLMWKFVNKSFNARSKISASGNCVAIVTDAEIYRQFSKSKTQGSERPLDKQS